MTRNHALSRRVFRSVFKLPAPLITELGSELSMRIPMPDGVDLLADRYFPIGVADGAGDDIPTILVRTCYSRKGSWPFVSRAFAERGYQTVVVNSRGTFGSGGGPFYAMHHEHDDGLATLDWVRAQPWYHGSMILAGGSYLGYTQWAVAADAPDDVVAMHPHVTSARLAQNFTSTGAIELDTAARWSKLTAQQELPRASARMALGIGERQLREAMNTLPLNIVDAKVIGEPSQFYQDTVTRRHDDPLWEPWDRRPDVPKVTIPASFLAGWYDPFLVDELRDYATLRKAGTPTRMTIGPWTHTGFGGSRASLWDTMEWSAIQTGRPVIASRGEVRVFVMGSNEWLDFNEWPPRRAEPIQVFLGSEAGDETLTAVPPIVENSTTKYRYDPSEPTPSVGGRLLLIGAGRKNNRALESRDDVVTFTSHTLTEDVKIVGEISADIWMSSTRPTWDLFVRLCDVDSRGRSWNVTDGLIRVPPAPAGHDPLEPVLIHVELSPTAQTFLAGHRIRVQVSSGAHPRFARNLGTTDLAEEGTEMFASDQTIYHDEAHPSSITLPRLP
jgi:putative CocE/NonD family hydrolase